MLVKSFLFNLFLSIGVFICSFYFAWQLSAASNFLYPLWYEVINIDQTIKTYGPKNKYKQDFELTTKQQHVALFAGIVTAIQNEGKGLGELYYEIEKNKSEHTLLTKSEIIHLKDVANLVSKFEYLLLLGVLAALIAFMLMHKTNVAFTSLKNYLLSGFGLITLLIILIFLIGPTKVFYKGHELIFPNNHQWFFYYEDSLMSTMMKAPVLFGPIAGQLLLITTIFWLFALYMLKKIENKF